MITTKDKTTTVVFGTHKKASISVGPQGMNLVLQQIVSDKKIGDSLLDEDIKELPKVVLELQTIESIDVLIRALEKVKENHYKIYGFALAC
jgi:hypothetical protein